MENSEEDFNEWQQIEYPSSSSSSETSSPRVHRSSSVVEFNTESVVNKDNNFLQKFRAEDDQSIVEEDSEDGTSTSPSEGVITMPAPVPPSDWRRRVVKEGGELLKLRFEAIRVWVTSKVRNCAMYVGAFWSITCVTGAAAAAVAVLVLVIYRRIQRRRRRVIGRQSVEHLVYLLREKDEKISQLLLQIAQLNEVLTSRCKVPVLRISS
ncbi:hypothetical protein RIF29_35519 [Crotalaria pallida]|uniref:Transmembrane protein n=1 Tax=Crotalaria pallida TaxID=3830 RepID=A0AAN9ECK8_CROPI